MDVHHHRKKGSGVGVYDPSEKGGKKDDTFSTNSGEKEKKKGSERRGVWRRCAGCWFSSSLYIYKTLGFAESFVIIVQSTELNEWENVSKIVSA